ncbi:sulfate/thiosulfate import ATP-binding protein CysA [Aliidongia dinghuensis]|uniref:Sulfate/thiosulfate import ATP-binding protein CysA n=1 Tax=Aliidongia dinghuensis TaxID=1867774 RepID=A0A8J2YYF5_9PROT|nr:sulfate/molybdate ABC transporter ATP-binding protein [Aliidongia dinghuensis]GGF35693.1 sulfate/thiosulfate import ATP-binding protein CysA [Aliidongia dinghuensis]
MQIEISGIVCRYGTTPAVSGVDLTIADGEFLALLGPSGSGKTTLLRTMAGLETPEAGSLHFGETDALALPPNRRGVGFVFQHYALFKHMTVADNIAFGLTIRPRSRRPGKAVIAARVAELLELVHLPGLGQRYPQQLSGGQRQRVALARALAVEPKILLLDEPFGALDAKVRTELRLWLKELHRRLGVTTVFVTHDQEEAMELADRIVVMRAGRIEQVGTPADVYAAPASPFVYGFLGHANEIPCTITAGVARAGSVVLDEGVALPDGPAVAWFRPHQVELAPFVDGPALDGMLVDLHAIGPRARLTLDHDGALVTAELGVEEARRHALAEGHRCRWRPRQVRVYPRA